MFVAIFMLFMSHLSAIILGILADGKRAQEFCWEAG